MTRLEVRGSLGDFASAWDALVDRSQLPSPFLRSWWLEGVAGPGASFVLVLDDHGLVGGLALEEDRPLGVARLRLLGLKLGADHLDLVAAPGRVEEVVQHLGEWLRRPGPRAIDLDGVSEYANAERALPRPVRRELADIAPWTPLPPTFAEYLAARPGKLRSQIERPLRRLRGEGAEHRVIDTAGCDEALAELRRLHDSVFGHRSLFLPHFERFARAARVGVERGEMVFHEFVVGGQAIAVNVSFEVAGRLSYYQGGRDADPRWRGAGTALMARCVEHACEAGCHEFDLLRGAEPYKLLWTTRIRELLRLRASFGMRGRAMLSVLPFAYRAKRAALRWREGVPRSSQGAPDGAA